MTPHDISLRERVDELEDENMRLNMRLRELKEGLCPFAQEGFQAALGGNVQGDDSPVYGREKSVLTLGDFRRAKKLLEDE